MIILLESLKPSLDPLVALTRVLLIKSKRALLTIMIFNIRRLIIQTLASWEVCCMITGYLLKFKFLSF